MRDDAREVDGRFDPGVAAANDRHPLALEQRSIAVWAVGDAVPPVFFLAGDVHFPPACPSGQDHRLAPDGRAAGQPEFDQSAVCARQQGFCALQIDDIHVVFPDVLLQRGRELRTVGLLDRDEVLDGQRVEHLSTEALADHPGANPLAGSIDGGGGAGRTAADDQHVEGRTGRNLVRLTLQGTGIDLANDFLERHATLPERLAVQQDGRYPHDLAGRHFILVQRTIDHLMADAGVQHGHQVECLNDIRTVVAGKRDEGFEVEATGYGADLLDHARLGFRRMPTGVQQGQDQGGEFVAHRNAGEADPRRLPRATDGKGRLARGVAVVPDADLGRKRRDILQQCKHLLCLATAVERSDQFDRLLELFEISPELSLDVVVEHVSLS